MITGTQSGCGKTTVTLALMQHLRARGLTVAPFKAGPDFLDPMWHECVCGRTSYNLDTRMMDEHACKTLLVEKSVDADMCVIEGVMGLFDGASGVGGVGSSVHLAQMLDVPVVLVVDAGGMSGSIVPLVEGFVARAGGMRVTIAGIVANHVGSEHHAHILRKLLAAEGLPPLVAWLDKNASVLPERHLGLKMPHELELPDFSAVLHIEQEAFTAEAQRPQSFAEKNMMQTLCSSASPRLCGTKIVVAKDVAFCFIYPANIEWLQQQGAEVLCFSPMAGEAVPEKADALWLPGGYPELHAEALSKSNSWKSLRSFIEMGKPVLAECGGMMVLGESIDGVAMAGVLPCAFEMQNKLTALGYREETGGVRGHEFHHSKRETLAIEIQSHEEKAFHVVRGDAGVRYKNLRASYIHWYFPSQPDAVANWFGQ